MADGSAYIDDGTTDFSLGQDAWHRPNKIQANQYARGVNVKTKGGILSPRDVFHQAKLIFADQTVPTSMYGRVRTIQDIWTSGKFQAAIPVTSGSDDYILTVICGLLFKVAINKEVFNVTLLSPELRVNQYQPKVNWSYADQYVVIFDFPNYPLLVNENGVVTRADPNYIVNGEVVPQVPISNLGTYNQNRLFVGNAGVDITAGDPVGSKLFQDAPITFAEIFTPSSPFVDQFFSLPSGNVQYPITAMGFLQELDASTGIGPLFVSTEKSFYFYKTNQPRENWEVGQFGGTLLNNAGVAGARAFVNVNSDIIFLSSKGFLHAMSTSRNEAQRWGNVPISREVQNYLKFWDVGLSKYAVLGYFNNKIFISANPYRVQATDISYNPVPDYAHGGFIVLELENVASLLSDGPPVWAGVWTGVNPIEICNLRDRCFVFSKDGVGANAANALYEVKDENSYDVVNGRKRRVRSYIYTRSYNFQQPFSLKRESTALLHLYNIQGQLDLRLERKPTQSSGWLRLADWKYNAPVESKDIPFGAYLNGYAGHNFKELVFGDGVESGCSPINQDSYEYFTEIQYRLTLQGKFWELDSFKTRATLEDEVERQDEELCEEKKPIEIPLQCDPDWLIPEVDDNDCN